MYNSAEVSSSDVAEPCTSEWSHRESVHAAVTSAIAASAIRSWSYCRSRNASRCLIRQALDRPPEPRDPAGQRHPAIGRSMGESTGTAGDRTICPRCDPPNFQSVGRNVPGFLRPSSVLLSPAPMSRIPTRAMKAFKTSLAPSPMVLILRVADHPLVRLVAEIALAAEDLERLVHALARALRS